MLKNRLFSIILCIAILCPLLVSCGEKPLADVPVKTLLAEALALFENNENVDIYHSDANETDDTYFEPGLAGQVFLGEYGASLAEDGVIAEYAHAIPSALFAFEIDIFKATDAVAADTLETLLQTRMEIKAALRSQIVHYLDSGDAAVNELKALDDMEIWRIGNYVLLLATHNNTEIKNRISTLLGAATDTAVTDAESAVSTPQTEAVTEGIDPAVQAAGDGFSLTVTSHSSPFCVVLGGRCAPGAKIHIKGGIRDYVFNTDYTSWMGEVEIRETGESLLKIQQELDGVMSDPLTVEIGPDRGADLSHHGDFVPFMGDSFQGYFAQQLGDWMGTNLLSDAAYTKAYEAVQEKVRFCEFQGIKLIYMVIPNQCMLYPETMPEDRFARSTADYTLYDQFRELASEAGATVLDVYPVMEEHKNDEFKLYHKTDSHWTDYGAYWGYHTLMTEIAKTYPDAAPLPIDGNLRFYTKEVESGDIMTFFGIANDLVPEQATFAEWLIDYPNRIDFYKPNRCENDNSKIQMDMVITNPNAKGKNMPRAMVIRDSYSFNAYAFLNQSFSKIYWNYTWDYQFKKNDIKKADVDYLIYLISEKNLPSILY